MNNSTCLETDCSDATIARGLCEVHYGRAKRRGALGDYPKAAAPTRLERLTRSGWEVTESGCWEWGGSRDGRGYGTVSVGSDGHPYAHRFSYETFIGKIPDGHVICHRCDNPPCINPAHLFVGTQADNVQDMVSKGRMYDRRGIKRGKYKPRSSIAN